MKHLIFGPVVLLFGIFIGGVGLATAGVGKGIPMVPLGIYLTYRGWRIYKHEEDKQYSEGDDSAALDPLEHTKGGKIGTVPIGQMTN